jgi:hypothetical protein
VIRSKRVDQGRRRKAVREENRREEGKKGGKALVFESEDRG